jgi:hypothetical protein
MVRYERHARLAAEWAKIPVATRERCEAAAAQLEELILGRCRRGVSGGDPS